ncbi:HNH endonuclease signature motif containing protein [Amycolatopsis saalfeldensis]|uniref:HNH endonuclease n=1 Tax=Amycolatopsis saalfeldensis TaxID=394193 RepID=A0A1H8YE68_9PSEU|nr:HNH endonuclease signature motif containing protein [Amycolatopsis saalfeldensis]SEP50407.1 HNH endonuclease [Amycolatopsis saalfeldensis]
MWVTTIRSIRQYSDGVSTTTDTHEVWQLSDTELTTFLLACEEELRRDHAEMLGLVNEVERRGLGRALGFKDTAAMLRETLRVSGREAATRVAHAHATRPSSSPTGAPQPASLAATGQALLEGVINREHLQTIVNLFATCPAAIGPGNRAADEATLISLARQAAPEALRTAGRRLLAYWGDYATPPDDRQRRELRPSRRLTITHRPDGSARFAGELDPDATAVLDGLLGPLAKPRRDPDTEGPDPRSAAERRGDALADILELAARCDDLAVQGGERAVMIVTVTLAELEGRLTDTLSTTPGGLDALRRQACEAKVVPAVFGAEGQPLHLGRTTRLATPSQRHALALRDKGCAHPGCDRSPKWCIVHHVIPWSEGGPTDLPNLVLLCPAHHRIVHHSAWTIRMRNGIPEFLPPPWLDPDRTPRRNHVHDAVPPRHRQTRRRRFHYGRTAAASCRKTVRVQ